MSDIVERLDAFGFRCGAEGRGPSAIIARDARDEIERLRAACDAAFMAMCAYRDNGDAELFQDAIDALGRAALTDRS